SPGDVPGSLAIVPAPRRRGRRARDRRRGPFPRRGPARRLRVAAAALDGGAERQRDTAAAPGHDRRQTVGGEGVGAGPPPPLPPRPLPPQLLPRGLARTALSPFCRRPVVPRRGVFERGHARHLRAGRNASGSTDPRLPWLPAAPGRVRPAPDPDRPIGSGAGGEARWGPTG